MRGGGWCAAGPRRGWLRAGLRFLGFFEKCRGFGSQDWVILRSIWERGRMRGIKIKGGGLGILDGEGVEAGG